MDSKVGNSRLLQNKERSKREPVFAECLVFAECVLRASCSIILTTAACTRSSLSTSQEGDHLFIGVSPLLGGSSLRVRSNIIYYVLVTRHYLPVTSTKQAINTHLLTE